ncbi:MAG: response regulator [Elusimicrobiota bacterium]
MTEIKVMLVDDEEELVRVLGRRLEKRGFQMTTALNGEEALSNLEAAAQDVVILDVFMPGISGIETLKKIKAQHPLTEVVMLSGHATLELAVEGMQYGAFDFLTKPADMGDLVEKINKAYSRRVEHEERIKNASFVKDQITAGSLDRRHASGAMEKGDLPESGGKLLVLGYEGGFSRKLMEYALDLSKRMSYSIVALNAAGFDSTSFNKFPKARERVCTDFREISEKNAALFRQLAEKEGIPFAHVVKCIGRDEAIDQVTAEIGPVDYIVSESASGPNKGQIFAYCPI